MCMYFGAASGAFLVPRDISRAVRLSGCLGRRLCSSFGADGAVDPGGGVAKSGMGIVVSILYLVGGLRGASIWGEVPVVVMRDGISCPAGTSLQGDDPLRN